MRRLLIICAAALGLVANVSALDLSAVTSATTIADGETVTGTLGRNVKLSIADGATVTLSGATINGTSSASSYKWAGLSCLGNATIILEGVNTVRGFNDDYPGIYVPQGKTLTIRGGGSLTASSNGYGSGIGGGYYIACGSIVIEEGDITATGGNYAAGIGSGWRGYCGGIFITGGTITATGGNGAAGIGGGPESSCGVIAIGEGVTRVTATAVNSRAQAIGAGANGTCDSVAVSSYVTDSTEDLTRTIVGTPWNNIFDLSTLTTGYRTFESGTVITGTLGGNAQVSIAAGATVKLFNVTINGKDSVDYPFAGITCQGDATIILEGKNTVKGFWGEYPGISIDDGYTLTIKGSGSLDVRCNDGSESSSLDAGSAGIGGSRYASCGNIVIEGGTITATSGHDGGMSGAAIGSGAYGTCGDITIRGGTVTATGGNGGAGIGAGYGPNAYYPSCFGNITISGGTVTAKGGYGADSIGHGRDAGEFNIGGEIIVTEDVTSLTLIGGEDHLYHFYGAPGSVIRGNITESPFVYPKRRVDLSAQTGDFTARDGDVLYGDAEYGVTVPDGATVKINGVVVSGSAKQCTLTVNPNGGTYGGKDAATTLSPNLMFGSTSWRGIGTPTRTGYTFKGWFTAASGGTMVWDAKGQAVKGAYWTDSYANRGTWKYDAPGGVLTVYAQWTAKQYSLTANPNNGTYNGKTTASTLSPNLTYGTTSWRGIGMPTRTGYAFLGWFTAASGGTMVWDAKGQAVKGAYWTDSYANRGTWKYDGNITVYAQWKVREHKLTVVPNGGTYSGKTAASTLSPNLTYGTTSWRGIGMPTRSGYTFTGWFTASSGGKMVWDANGQAVKGDYWTDSYANRGTWKYDAAVETFTVYAQWKLSSGYYKAPKQQGNGLGAWMLARGLKADDVAANGRTVSECYALGLDPESTNDFRIVSIDMADGNPKVDWEPKTNRWTGEEIKATLKGATSLDAETWETVTEENKSSFKFFRVEAE